MTNTMQINNLNVSYHGNQVLKNITFSFKTGSLIGIIGPNGAGKSTLMKSILGLTSKDSGEVTFLNEPIKKARKKIAYVPQRSDIDWDFPILVRDTVLLGTFPKLGLFKRPGKKDKELAMQCLKKVGMADYSDRQIAELSGGQQQRVFLARALAQQADFFFLDEPFVGIDIASEQVIINILKDLRNDGKTIFVVHHDLSKVETYFDKLVLINKELFGAGAIDQVFQREKIEKCYHMNTDFNFGLGVGI